MRVGVFMLPLMASLPLTATGEVILVSQSRQISGIAAGVARTSLSNDESGPWNQFTGWYAGNQFAAASVTLQSVISTSVISGNDLASANGGRLGTSSNCEFHVTSNFYVDTPTFFDLTVDLIGVTNHLYSGTGVHYFRLSSTDRSTVFYEVGSLNSSGGEGEGHHADHITGVFTPGYYTLVSEGYAAGFATGGSRYNGSQQSNFVLIVPAPTTLAAFLPLLTFAGRRRR